MSDEKEKTISERAKANRKKFDRAAGCAESRHSKYGRCHAGKRPPAKERVAGHRNVFRRANDMRNNWPQAYAQLRNESVGSNLALHHMSGDLTNSQVSVGRFYAVLAGHYDRVQGLPKRSVASPSYNSGWGREDDLARHEANGTMKDFDRRVRRLKRDWRMVEDAIGASGEARAVVDHVCIEDRSVATIQIPVLVAALELLARAFAFDSEGNRHRKIRSYRAPTKIGGAK